MGYGGWSRFGSRERFEPAMRVLIVHNRYRQVGGEERHIDLLTASLPSAGIEVRRFDASSPGAPSCIERAKLGATLTYRRAGGRLLHRALRYHQPDVVHFHNVFPLLTPAAMRAAHDYGAPVILTVHNYRFACPSGTLLRRGAIHEDCIEGSSLLCGLRKSRGNWGESLAYGFAIEAQRRLRLLHRWVDAYIAPSEFIATMLARAGYPRDRIHTIHHGTPIELSPSSTGDYAFYGGRLSAEKGVRTLLAAARRRPDIPLVIAGDGPLAMDVRAAGDNVSATGLVDSHRMGQLLRNARFTVAPSEWYEGLPFSVMESMAASKPVVASRLGGLAELVDEGVTGLLVTPRDPAALAEAMHVLWTDTRRSSQMGNAAWRYARENFSLEQQALQVVALYDRLLSHSAGGPAAPSPPAR